jgi:hypothetical protein
MSYLELLKQAQGGAKEERKDDLELSTPLSKKDPRGETSEVSEGTPGVAGGPTLDRGAPVLPVLHPGVPGFPSELARVLGLPLDQLDRVLRVAVPWLAGPLWFVPDEADAEALVAAGEARRGAVWTAAELMDLLAIPGMTKAQARTGGPRQDRIRRHRGRRPSGPGLDRELHGGRRRR